MLLQEPNIPQRAENAAVRRIILLQAGQAATPHIISETIPPLHFRAAPVPSKKKQRTKLL
jgi:hypothetical protein